MFSLAVVVLTSCGQSDPHHHHKKQKTSSDIKISALDLESKKIQLRFEYRSYVKKTLENISCDIEFNKQPPINITQSYSIELGAFSTEILSFQVANINQDKHLLNLSNINYEISCELTYNKGSEYISQSSVLHLVPSEGFLYR